MTGIVLETLLEPLRGSPIAWCGFDAAWYRTAYADVVRGVADRSDEGLRNHYVEHGRAGLLSPNMYFDEAWYRARNPDVTEAIAAGDFDSGYEHYCAVGYLTRSGHWLYDDALYARFAPDLTDQVLVTFGCANRYDHYLKAGARENRIAHLLFQPAVYIEAVTGRPDRSIV
jgi:hypothetical protein